MTRTTLNALIEIAYEDSETISQFKSKVYDLIDLWEEETKPTSPLHYPIGVRGFQQPSDKVPYHTLCSCNPANGGSGICGCTMANTMVDPNHSTQSTISTSHTFTTGSLVDTTLRAH